jgi:hypothetical protein
MALTRRTAAVALAAFALLAGGSAIAKQARGKTSTTVTRSGTSTTVTVKNPKPVLKRGLTAAELQAFPVECLKAAGQKHIRQIAKDEWQGTFAGAPFTAANASVWIRGPYRTIAQAQLLATSESKKELAYAGGIYVATATRRGALSIQASFAAACLSAATEQPLTF